MTRTTPEGAEPLGERPGFDDWADEVMSEMEARERTLSDALAARAARAGNADERRPMPQRLLSWLTGGG